MNRIRQWAAGSLAAMALATGAIAVAPGASAVPTTVQAPTSAVAAVASDYSFKSGRLMYNPPRDICSQFACIGNFWNGRGYVMQCRDGMLGKSGGIQGSCSWHGGNYRPLYWR